MWKNYVNFSDRTNRKGFWMAFLFNFLAFLILSFVPGGFLGSVYAAAELVPGIAITVRRLRDAGKHWAWIFISFLPLAGYIILIVMLCKSSVETAENSGLPTV